MTSNKFDKINEINRDLEMDDIELQKDEDKDFILYDPPTPYYGRYIILKKNKLGQVKLCIGPHCIFFIKGLYLSSVIYLYLF